MVSAERARRELGWHPDRTAVEALEDLLLGLRDGSADVTPPLAAETSAPLRAEEFATGVGQRPGVER